jgi:predicted nucleic acid-binding Zn ribbon protein
MPRTRKPPDWLIEERRQTLGPWAAFCRGCGHTLRYFEELEQELPRSCPQCGGEICSRCPTCNAPFASAFAVDCEACSARLRGSELFGTKIRRSTER